MAFSEQVRVITHRLARGFHLPPNTVFIDPTDTEHPLVAGTVLGISTRVSDPGLL